MLKAHKLGFIVISKGNLKEVSNLLKQKLGSVLIADPSYYGSPSDTLTGRFEAHLYGKPQIYIKNAYLMTDRSTGTRQTLWGCDREYRLYPTPQPSGDRSWDALRGWFKTLSIEEDYKFQIGFQSATGRGAMNDKELSLYIPQNVSVSATLAFAILWMTDLWNKQVKAARKGFQFTPQHIVEMVKYAEADLKTGEVLRHNVQAGQDADVAAGFPM
ncbi:TPA: hypothetical protein DCQ44_01100 [Candidatus Taylorbacteria bacterium]|nr:hypothetical protein [Candidatus Taylorbacteria bacterium]